MNEYLTNLTTNKGVFKPAIVAEWLCYKLIQSFKVYCLFTGQYNTEDYGTFTSMKGCMSKKKSCMSENEIFPWDGENCVNGSAATEQIS